MVNEKFVVASFLSSFFKNLPEPSMRNHLDALEGSPKSVLDTVTSALPRIAAQNTLALAYLVAKEDMQPLIVTFQNGNFGLLNLAKSAPKWIAVDAGLYLTRKLKLMFFPGMTATITEILKNSALDMKFEEYLSCKQAIIVRLTASKIFTDTLPYFRPMSSMQKRRRDEHCSGRRRFCSRIYREQ